MNYISEFTVQQKRPAASGYADID